MRIQETNEILKETRVLRHAANENNHGWWNRLSRNGWMSRLAVGLGGTAILAGVSYLMSRRGAGWSSAYRTDS